MKKIYLHALPLRIWHWMNALMVIFLLVTGVQLRISGIADLRPHDPSLMIHKYAGWTMVGFYVLWFIYSIVSKNLRNNYAFGKNDLKGTLSQAKFYLISIFRGEQNPFRPSPDNKFNPLQKIAYGSTMFILAPVIIITGLLYTDIGTLRQFLLDSKITGLVNAIHIMAAYMFALFLVIHVYMATLGPTPLSHIKAMITGYEEEHDEAAARPAEELQPAGPAAETESQGA
jgi:thiosulfate reductase cytochrome b subunit